MQRIFNFLKNGAKFLVYSLDLKGDFPVPPKYPSRMLSLHFWNSMFEIYLKRKLHQKRKSAVTTGIESADIKSFWKEANFEAPSYPDWLRTAMSKTYGVVVWEECFREMVQGSNSFFEAGCGSGLSSQCLLSFILENRMKTAGAVYDIRYRGLDLSEARVVLAQEYIGRTFGMIEGLDLDFAVGDLEKIDADHRAFDVSFIPSVLERVSDESIQQVTKEVARVTRKYIFISDFFDHYPDGWPRDHIVQSGLFERHGFKLVRHRYHLTQTERNQVELHLLFERVNN